VTVWLIVYTSDYPTFQMQAFIFKSIAVVTYTFSVRPFKGSGPNWIDAFNEACIMILTYSTIAYTDFIIDNEFVYQIGWYVIYMFGLCLMLNFGFISSKLAL
jgi:hypothetical protein